MARRRARLSQRALAERLECRQATIARWERGARQPSYADVQAVAHACSLQLDAHLVTEDRSWWPLIAVQLNQDPLGRVRRLSPPARFTLTDRLEALARIEVPVIIIGAVAGALHGWPLVLAGEPLEVCARPDAMNVVLERFEARLGAGGAGAPQLAVAAFPPGTAGFGDLARGAELVAVGGGGLLVAGLLDLLRIADASPDVEARRHALAYQAVLDVQRSRRETAVKDDRSDEEKIEAWLSRQTPAA